MEKEKILKMNKEKQKELKKLQKISVSTPNLLISMKALAALLRASISLSDSIKTVSEQSSDENLNKIFSFIYREIEEGSSLSEAMKFFPKVFSEDMVCIVDAGERGASLEKNLLFISESVRKAYELNKKLKGAIVYPLIIVGFTLVIFIAMIFFVLPKMEELYKSFSNIPEFTMFIMNASQSIRDNWVIILAITIVVLLLISLYLKSKPGKYFLSWLSLNFPIIKNIFKSNILASFSRTLGVLLESSLPLSKALLISSNTMGNYIYAKMLKEIYEKVNDGQNLSTCLAEHEEFFNKSFVKMVEIGELSGTLEENMVYLHDYYSDEVAEMSNNIVTLIEPILLIFVGGIIGILGITVLMPIYQLMGSINS